VIGYVRGVENQQVTGEQCEALRQRFGDEVLVKVTVLIGMYGLISRFQNAMNVPLDEGPKGFEVP
jgi:alkylhydroperoxidase family enzyme